MFLLYTFIRYFLIGLVNEYFYMFVSEDCSRGKSATVCICKGEYLMISVYNKYHRADDYGR